MALTLRCWTSSSSERLGITTWVPLLPSAFTRYRPMNPVPPKTVAVMPLTDERRPEPCLIAGWLKTLATELFARRWHEGSDSAGGRIKGPRDTG